VWELGEIDLRPAPFSLRFDATWISQHIQLAIDLTPFPRNQTFVDLDDSHEERWKTGTSNAYIAIIKYTTVVDPDKEDVLIQGFTKSWVHTAHRQAKKNELNRADHTERE
jgi:hypothetical protein